MSRLSRLERTRIAEITARLDAVRIGAASAVAEVLPAVRELLDADNAIFYSLAEQDNRWHVDRWHHAGDVARVRDLLSTAIASSEQVIVFYDPRAPAASMRNRVIEVTQRLERAEGPGSWFARRVCRDVFRPAGMERHKHLRALLCDGTDLLGWLGSLVPDVPDRHHFALLTALVPGFQRRLALERRLVEFPRTFGALGVALERIGAPALIVDAAGVVRVANASGRVLLDNRRAELAEAIVAARRGRPHPLTVELTPIEANGIPAAWVAIVRVDCAEARIRVAMTQACERWTLTPRQQTVLERVLGGESTATIAANLDISGRAVEHHVTALLQRADVESRAALVATVLATCSS
jgi:DNA-binding CsgD family transcriptional regulator